MGARVTGLSLTAVKGTRLRSVESITLHAGGALGDRRFFVIDERQRMVNGKQLGQLCRVVADCVAGTLILELPGGAVVKAPVRAGEPVRARFFSRMLDGRLVPGPWDQALSELCGRPLRLVEAPHGAVDRGGGGGVSLISRASLRRLAAQADEPDVDPRRFRMLLELDGIEAHEEDRWVGRVVAVGDARVRFGGHVGRCLITSRQPETGEIDLPTLDLLRGYRDALESSEPLPFGIYGAVVQGGEVRLGDLVSPVE